MIGMRVVVRFLCLSFSGLLLTGGVGAHAAETTGAAVYQQDVRPLTTLECARCHFSVFANIRDQGGKHQLECGYCHETYHTLRPGVAWEEVVPQCVTCHGEIHGPSFTDCLPCHTDAHAPVHSLVNMDVLGPQCGACHSSQGQEVNQFPSAHTEVACSDCHHDQHAYVENSAFMSCHPVHSPLEITYGDSVVNETCGTCHEKVQKKLKKGTKKHAELLCVYCHADRHRSIPDCRQCHVQPHPENLLQKFGGCAECHGDPHMLNLSD